MKLEKIGLPGLLALGAAGAAASALLGLAAGVAIARNPEAIRRTATRLAHDAAQGLEQATLFAAQAREQIGDLWAEAREAARAAVDTADFDRAAAAGPGVGPEGSGAGRSPGAADAMRDPSAAADAPAPARRPATRRRKAAGPTAPVAGARAPRAPGQPRARRAAASAPATEDPSRLVTPDATDPD
jgi:hypothetical protein